METIDARWDMMSSDCPTRDVLDRIASRWTLLVIAALGGRTLRFSELRRSVDGISHKMLTQTLRGLERDGMVEREVIATVPVTVRYTLTPLGHSLGETVEVIRDWAYANMDAIAAAREAYEPPPAGPPTPVAQASSAS